MKIFITGATGYIGGSVAQGLVEAGHEVTGLVRSAEAARDLETRGIHPLPGSLDDSDLLTNAARQADAVVNAAHADHREAAFALLAGLEDGQAFLHTSGSSIVGNRAEGKKHDEIYDEDSPLTPSPQRAARVALNQDILATSRQGKHPVVLCPSLIYGKGLGMKAHSMQVPWLIELARETGQARHIGPGENRWSNVHIADLVDLYLLALSKAPAGSFYFAENGENSMKEVCQAISRHLGQGGETTEMTTEEAARHWGEGPANDTMASNSRVRAKRAREDLHWTPNAPSLLSELESGCYKQDILEQDRLK
ncbi:NAD-dependent epimerase/dehydratase family protein [Rhodovibrionaceae bacterium A322]